MAYIRSSLAAPNRFCSSAIYILTFCVFFFILGYIIVIPTETIIQFFRTSVTINNVFQKDVLPARPTDKPKTYDSFICDNKDDNRFPVSTTTSSFKDSFDIYRKATLEKYCNIVPMPDNQWITPQTYTDQDIAYVIVTSSSFYHTRATATRDTWLSRITNYYFLSSTHYPHLPVTVVPGAGEDKSSNMKKLFHGLQIIYQEQMKLPPDQQQKWFFIIDCDTFILPHHLLKRLDGVDHTQAILLGSYSGKHECPREKGKAISIEYPSGNAGFFLSMKLLEILQPKLTEFVEKVWKQGTDTSDIPLSCLAARLGVRLTKQNGFWSQPPAAILAQTGRENFDKESEPNNFHFIKPNEMYALDEFYVNQHMDRLIKDQNWKDLIQYNRRFIASHYELLRKKRRECTLPKIEDEPNNS